MILYTDSYTLILCAVYFHDMALQIVLRFVDLGNVYAITWESLFWHKFTQEVIVVFSKLG